MRFRNLILSTFAGLAFVGCSNENDPLTGGDPAFKGDVAYMTVNIRDVNAGTRATTDGGWVDGSETEHTVSTAHFYFFDTNGTFVTQGTVWNGGSEVDGDTGHNVEYIGKNVIVLDNLKEKGLPSYILTVLNQPTGFTPEATLEATSKKLVNWQNTSKEFVMATTSYYGNQNNYYVTAVTPDDFKTDPTLAAPVIDVYVERLAAKVEMKVGTGLTNEEVINGNTYYKVTATVAGNENNEGGDDVATTELYVRIDGWALNATTKNSYLSKQLDYSWMTTAPFTNWNDGDNNFRCYWGKSTVFGENVADYITKDLVTYKTYSQLDLIFPGVGYCNENTNTAAKINPDGVFNPAAVTSVLVKATICDKTGQPLDMVRYNGLMFTKDQFLQYALNTIDLGKGNLNVWVKTTEGEGEAAVDKYTQIDKSSAKLAYDDVDVTGVGAVKVVSNLAVGTYYYWDNETDKYVQYTDYDAANNAFKGMLATAAIKGEAFTGGKMYYNIPIEHLGAKTATPAPNPITQEGYYGVVRNHWYELTINEIAKLGHGVYLPGEGEEERPIIPDPEKDTYYLGAKINILSWKLVKQNVSL